MNVVERDPSLPHQMHIGMDRKTNKIRVSCNCLAWHKRPDGGARPRRTWMPGEPKDFPEAMAIYNNPDNHNIGRKTRFAYAGAALPDA